MNLALIGNCAYQALIDDRARVVWLCWPRFDSSFVFGALLDETRGGQFAVEPVDPDGGAPPAEVHQDYLRNTNVLSTVFRGARGSFEVVDFAPRFRQYERFFKPTMLVRRIRRLSGEPVVRVRCRPTYDYARATPRVTSASNHLRWDIPGHDLRLSTNVPLDYVLEERPFLLEQDAWLLMTWGPPLEAPIEETGASFLERTCAYWKTWVKHTTIPGCFQQEVVRSALALKLHQYEATGAITAATTTSLPEFPGSGRNWDYRFCWLRDAFFTLRAMRRLGHFEELESFVSFLENLAALHPDLQPVYGISGETRLDEHVLPHLAGYQGSGPVRIGNAAYLQRQNDVYGEMIAAISPLFTDFRFEERRGANVTQLLGRLLDHVEQNLEAPDAGLWEIRDDWRVHTFSLLFHWLGGKVAGRIGQRAGVASLAARGQDLAARARALIEARCYRPDPGFYADSFTTANPDAALLMLINLGYLDPRDPRAERHLRHLQRELVIDGHLMQRYRHDDGLGQTEAAFTVCGFWLVEALARLGHREEAEAAFERLLRYRNHVGLYSEDVDPRTGALLGNFPQTYSHVGVINAAFTLHPFPPEIED